MKTQYSMTQKRLYVTYLFMAFCILLLCRKTAFAATTYTYNITDYGAKGDDTESDREAIQQALDMASDDHKIEVIVPAGTYYIDKTLYIQSNTTLKLKKGAVIIRNNDGVNHYMLKCSDKNHSYKGYGKYSLAHDITITGGTWDGGNIKKATSTSNLLYLGHCENITIKNTTIKNCYGNHAIELAGVRNSTIKNCKISGFRYGKDKFTSEAIQLDVCYKSKKDGLWTPGYEADKTPCKNIIIEKNTITDYPRGVGVHHYLKKKYCSNITIRKNKFVRSSASTQYKCSSAVFMMGARKVTISNNTVDHYYYGALIKSCKKMTVKNNTFKNTSICGVAMDGCDKNNGRRWFSVTNKKRKKKLSFTCPYILHGTVTTKGATYSFTAKDGKASVKFPKKPKKGQQIDFYGKDAWNNKYYRTYYAK